MEPDTTVGKNEWIFETFSRQGIDACMFSCLYINCNWGVRGTVWRVKLFFSPFTVPEMKHCNEYGPKTNCCEQRFLRYLIVHVCIWCNQTITHNTVLPLRLV